MPLPQLRRVRWAVRAALTLGVAASVAANILHARPNPVSQVIAAWPPLALLLTVELISRVPVHRRSLAAVRLAATSLIAGIAAWVSYWHMAGVAARYGETGPSPYLLPLSVDGLIIVASVSLVELAGRIRAVETAEATAVEATVKPVPVPVPVPVADGATVVTADPASPADPEAKRSPARQPGRAPATKAAPAKAAPAKAARAKAAPAKTARVKAAPAKTAAAAPRKRAAAEAAPAETTPAKVAPANTTPAQSPRAETTPNEANPVVAAGAAGRELSPAELVKLAELMKADRPTLTQAAIAAELGITPQRLQQARRQVSAAA